MRRHLRQLRHLRRNLRRPDPITDPEPVIEERASIRQTRAPPIRVTPSARPTKEHPISSQTMKGADTVGRWSRGQKVAIGLTGLPDVPAKRTGATARWKSHWPSSAAVVAHN